MQILYSQLEEELRQIYEDNPVQHARSAIKTCEKYLELLKQQLTEQPFHSIDDEITFFKEVKPQFLSKLIYHISLYNLCVRKPDDTSGEIIKYYDRELKHIRNFRRRNEQFCHYMRSKNTFLDEKLFTRAESGMNMYLDPEFYCFDRSFGTTHDHVLARLMANQAIAQYIGEQLGQLGTATATFGEAHANSTLEWTDPKVDLVELIYALHAVQCLNHGNIELHEIVAVFEKVFNLELDDVYRTFMDIKIRKTPTKFLNALQTHLMSRIHEERKSA